VPNAPNANSYGKASRYAPVRVIVGLVAVPGLVALGDHETVVAVPTSALSVAYVSVAANDRYKSRVKVEFSRPAT
jgi:hypothetical protein